MLYYEDPESDMYIFFTKEELIEEFKELDSHSDNSTKAHTKKRDIVSYEEDIY